MKPDIDVNTKIQAGVDKVATQLAIVRLQTEIEDLQSKIKAIHNSKSVGERGILMVGFLMLLAIILLAFDSSRLVGLYIIVVTALIYIYLQRETTEQKRIDKELKILLNELDMKEKELQANQQVIVKP